PGAFGCREDAERELAADKLADLDRAGAGGGCGLAVGREAALAAGEDARRLAGSLGRLNVGGGRGGIEQASQADEQRERTRGQKPAEGALAGRFSGGGRAHT